MVTWSDCSIGVLFCVRGHAFARDVKAQIYSQGGNYFGTIDQDVSKKKKKILSYHTKPNQSSDCWKGLRLGYSYDDQAKNIFADMRSPDLNIISDAADRSQSISGLSRAC